jgi:molybdopterin/thiamine biosynthesis adenylyltransferase
MTTSPASTAAHPRLARARALVVGVGGVGSPAALALARAGIGELGLVDPDVVEVSNLHRQPLYGDADIGRAKVDVAAERLRTIAPALRIVTWRERFPEAAAGRALPNFDVVLDGTDTIAAKFAVNDAAVAARVPLVHAGVLGFRGQIMTVLPATTACYRCIFEDEPPPGEVPSCEEAGILGPTAALVGALAAAESVRVVTGTGASYANRLLVIDTLDGRHRSVSMGRRPHCRTCGGALRRALGSMAS